MKKNIILGCILLKVGLLYAATHSTDISNNARQLGWIIDKNSRCGGYYQDPLAAYINIPLFNPEQCATTITADQSSLTLTGTSSISGNIVVEQPGRSILANKANFQRNQTGALTQLNLDAGVKYQEAGLLVFSKQAEVDFQKTDATLNGVIYRISLRKKTQEKSHTQMPLDAWGQAKQIDIQKKGLVTLTDTTYSTCAPVSPIWEVKAKKLILNRSSARGEAYNAWLEFKGIPLVYVPYFNFPLNSERKTGFLLPNLSSSQTSGFQIASPYYWNIAPNYDVLFTPIYYAKRNIQLNGKFRYLTPASVGEVDFSYLPSDPAFENFIETAPGKYSNTVDLPTTFDRRFLSWIEQRRWGPRWTSQVNFNYVGDDYYVQDFNNPQTIANNELLQQGVLNYNGDVWNLTTRITRYEVLHPVTQAPSANPYNSLPAIEIDTNPQQYYGFNYEFANQFVYFQQERNLGQTIPSITAARVNVQPTVSWPVLRSYGFFVPRLQLSFTQYNLGNQINIPQNIQRITPIFDIDSGLYFDRPVSISDTAYRQTFEPRIFYLYVPYRDQSNIPLFDTALIPFSYDSLFTTSRFNGIDRIGDADQVSLAFTTRFIEEATGLEKFTASIGQIFYFKNRKVFLCSPLQDHLDQNVPGSICTDPNAIVGVTSPTEKFSPLAGRLTYQFNPRWSTSANIAWDPTSHNIITAGANFQYSPMINYLFNVNYTRIRFGDILTTNPPTPVTSHQNDFNRLGLSFALPLNEKWSSVGGWGYNFSRAYTQDFFYGLQYDTCCWAIRSIYSKSFYQLDSNGNPILNRAIYLQIELKGLSTLSTNDITNFLRSNIPGYAPNST